MQLLIQIYLKNYLHSICVLDSLDDNNKTRFVLKIIFFQLKMYENVGCLKIMFYDLKKRKMNSNCMFINYVEVSVAYIFLL